MDDGSDLNWLGGGPWVSWSLIDRVEMAGIETHAKKGGKRGTVQIQRRDRVAHESVQSVGKCRGVPGIVGQVGRSTGRIQLLYMRRADHDCGRPCQGCDDDLFLSGRPLCLGLYHRPCRHARGGSPRLRRVLATGREVR